MDTSSGPESSGQDHINLQDHPIGDVGYGEQCRDRFDAQGALVLEGFFTARAVAQVVSESAPREAGAFYTKATHNVWLTLPDPGLPTGHVFNRQIVSTKGLIADDQVPTESPLRMVYDDTNFRGFLCRVLGIEEIHPYSDNLSSINVHFAAAGMELGWHFDNSSFAVTMLLQAPEGGGVFEYVADVRDSQAGDQAFGRVEQILNGDEPVKRLSFTPGDLVLFRGRDALHRVTPTIGSTTRLLTVFAYNHQPGVALSDSAKATFYGRA